MRIGEASRRTGLTARAIRLYESAGIIGAPSRSERGCGIGRGDHEPLAIGRDVELPAAGLVGHRGFRVDCDRLVELRDRLVVLSFLDQRLAVERGGEQQPLASGRHAVERRNTPI